jgi:hypothetical protein
MMLVVLYAILKWMVRPLLGTNAPMKMLARNQVTYFLCGLLYATIELGFLCMVRADPL